MDRIIATWPLRHGEEVRVTLSSFRGRTYLHARRYWQDEAGDWQPGKGLALPAEDLPRLRRAVLEAERVALEAGLIPEESYELIGEAIPPALKGVA